MPLNDFEYPAEHPEWHDVMSVTLGELVQDGWVDWTSKTFDWSSYAYDGVTYERLCKGIEERYWYREIGLIPPKRWQKKLMYKLRYELCPKYNRLYEAAKDGINVLQDADRYGKRRKIRSDYPETLASGNADYLTTGDDEQYEDVTDGDAVEKMSAYMQSWRDLDASFIEELEPLFASIYTVGIGY